MYRCNNMDISQFIEARRSDDNVNKCYEYNDVSICMIDIVGFSKWCSKYSAKDVVKTMIEYNDTITAILRSYDNLTKIELVGDSCMVIGGMDESQIGCHVSQMIEFSNQLLKSNLNPVIFNSDYISVRIGIHVGNIFGTFINHPFRFQMFGNDINTTSRLESTSHPGVIHISSKAMNMIHKPVLVDELDYGNITTKCLKGVGDIDSAFLTMKKKSILLIEDLMICQKVIVKYLKDYELEICCSSKDGMAKLKQSMYTAVFMDTHYGNELIYPELYEFRIWETKYRSQVQPIIAVTAYADMKHSDSVMFDTVIQKTELGKLRKIIDDIVNSKPYDADSNPPPKKKGIVSCLFK